MFSNNPFADISVFLSPYIMQSYVIAMVVLVVCGTIYDTLHKKSAKYFFQNWRNSKKNSVQDVSKGQLTSIAIHTLIVDSLLSGEFCNLRRRIAHLLGMYGFILFVGATAVMIFVYPTHNTPTPALVSQIWHLGALMICVGGYWFWFFIRVDVAAEGNSPFRVVKADLFILSLLASATFGLLWSYLQANGSVWAYAGFGMHIIATTVLFGSVPWSKFAHMFFKPAAAFQKRVEEANGTRNNMPAPANEPEKFGTAREQARNY
tara:strand:- start:1733 stop:2518 length:786 start_codon:yes stop_codon:yes gene_type:complete